jgi:hypothetical protein
MNYFIFNFHLFIIIIINFRLLNYYLFNLLEIVNLFLLDLKLVQCQFLLLFFPKGLF